MEVPMVSTELRRPSSSDISLQEECEEYPLCSDTGVNLDGLVMGSGLEKGAKSSVLDRIDVRGFRWEVEPFDDDWEWQMEVFDEYLRGFGVGAGRGDSKFASK